MRLAERGRGHAALLIEDAVELGEAVEAALSGDVGNLVPGMEQELLGFADAGHLDVFGQGEAGDGSELVR